MKEELNQTIDELNEVIKEKRLNILDKDLLDFALKLYITESINKQKQFYPKNERNEFNRFLQGQAKEMSKTSPLTSKDELPTEKQIYAIKKAGITIPAGLTRREASTIIKRIKGEK